MLPRQLWGCTWGGRSMGVVSGHSCPNHNQPSHIQNTQPQPQLHQPRPLRGQWGNTSRKGKLREEEVDGGTGASSLLQLTPPGLLKLLCQRNAYPLNFCFCFSAPTSCKNHSTTVTILQPKKQHRSNRGFCLDF